MSLAQPENTYHIILMYHSVGSSLKDSLSLDQFKKQLTYTLDKFRVVPIMEVTNGEETNSTKPEIVLTFDDGYRNFYETIYPFLEEQGIPATVFVSPSLLKGSDVELGRKRHNIATKEDIWMSEDELHEVNDSELVTVGNHTLSHANLNNVSTDEYEREIVGGKHHLEEIVGHDVKTFSYPYGKGWDIPEVKQIVSKHHDLAVTTRPGYVTNNTDPYELKRVDVPDSILKFRLLFTTSYLGWVQLKKLKRRFT